MRKAWSSSLMKRISVTLEPVGLAFENRFNRICLRQFQTLIKC